MPKSGRIAVDRILAEFAVQMPDLRAQLAEIASTLGTLAYDETLACLWPQVVKQTIDYGVMERAKGAVVIPAAIGWTDVGSWGSLRDLLLADGAGNVVTGPHLALDTHRSLVVGSTRLIATIGVHDFVIVDADDALLICPQGREQDVRQLVDQLKARGLNRWL